MTLTQLLAFVAAAQHGTFTRAAQELRMSQPAVSDLIRRLEDELGTTLFHRTTRSLTLTHAGEQLLPHAQQSVASARLGRIAVQSQLELGGGTATFGLLRNADYYLSTNLALAFHRRHPAVNIRLVGQNSAETAADVSAGRLEAGLISLPVPDDGLEVVPLARDEVLFVTNNNGQPRRPPTTEEFADLDLVLYDAHYATSDPARRQLNERAQLAGRELNPVIEVEYLSTALGLVAAGVGATIACRAATVAEAMPPALLTSSFAEPMYDTLALIKRRGMALSPATRELARMALHALRTHQGSSAGTAEMIADDAQVERFFAQR